MNTAAHIAKHFREVISGGNWTAVNWKETLAGITREQAISKVGSFNTIAALTYHMGYYVRAVLNVLEGSPLEAKDKYSFDHPPIESEDDWNTLLEKTWSDAEKLAALTEQMPEKKLWEVFVDPKYGNYYRNLHGVIEHCHYHLGQVVYIKKWLAEKPTAP